MNITNGFSLLFYAITIVILMCSFNRITFRMKRARVFFCMLLSAAIVFTASSGTWFLGRNSQSAVCMGLQSVVFLGVFSLLYFYTAYLVSIIEAKEPVFRSIIYIDRILCAAGVVIWMCQLLTGQFSAFEDGRAGTGGLYMTGHVICILIVSMDFFLLLRYGRVLGISHTLMLLSLLFIPVMAMLLEHVFPNISIRIHSIFFPLIFIYTKYNRQMERQLEQKEIDLLKSRVSLMAGRMRPHYLYNVLSTIYYLCDRNPQQAKEAINIFSDYLRNTLEAMERAELVPLSWERQTIRNYVSLEKIRYGSKLHVESKTDVNENDVRIPPFSVQPLVENAIRHGISRKKEGGNIFVHSKELPDGTIRISVRDDGVGYDVHTVPEGEGITNVRERLKMQCGGSLTIESRPGEGTSAVIVLPPLS